MALRSSRKWQHCDPSLGLALDGWSHPTSTFFVLLVLISFRFVISTGTRQRSNLLFCLIRRLSSSIRWPNIFKRLPKSNRTNRTHSVDVRVSTIVYSSPIGAWRVSWKWFALVRGRQEQRWLTPVTCRVNEAVASIRLNSNDQWHSAFKMKIIRWIDNFDSRFVISPWISCILYHSTSIPVSSLEWYLCLTCIGLCWTSMKI